MANLTSEMSQLLGAYRREKNGAVADFMTYYGARYGLNYGVSIPTVRSIAQTVEPNYALSKLLYRQQVRELQLAAFWIAPREAITLEELSFWAEGIRNSEIAEEAAFSLFRYIPETEKWLYSEVEMLQYCALRALAIQPDSDIEKLTKHETRLITLLEKDSHLLSLGVVALLSSMLKFDDNHIRSILDRLPSNHASDYVREELSWRMEL